MLVTSKIGEQLTILEISFTKPSTVTVPTIVANSEDVIVYIDFITSQFEADLDAATINAITAG